MTTKIKNIETGEIVEITMIDPKTGCDWSGDFINGMDIDSCDDDDADLEADAETIEWWENTCSVYSSADERYQYAYDNCDWDHVLAEAERIKELACGDLLDCAHMIDQAAEWLEDNSDVKIEIAMDVEESEEYAEFLNNRDVDASVGNTTSTFINGCDTGHTDWARKLSSIFWGMFCNQ